jgi:hypothetical protein
MNLIWALISFINGFFAIKSKETIIIYANIPKDVLWLSLLIVLIPIYNQESKLNDGHYYFSE